MEKNQKLKILERYNLKEEKILISNVIDKAYKYEKENKLLYTNFLNLSETFMLSSILNELDVKYYVYTLNEHITKKCIFFIPDYIYDYSDTFFNQFINCIKITPNVKGKLLHKDYMGAIYSLGLKREMIGDIFVCDDVAYVFCINTVTDYIYDNLFKVANQEVKLEIISLEDKQIKNLKTNYVEKEYIVASMRVDAVLSVVYNLSRSEMKEKIVKGDLYINDKNIFYPNTILNYGDIISLRKCGKIKIGEQVRKTKSNNLVLNIFKYV